MKAVMKQVSEDILAWRRKTGADRWDEVWEGVLHMSPNPSRGHQELVVRLWQWLEEHWAKPNGCRASISCNVAEAGTWPGNYRIPDLVLLTPARFSIDHDLYLDGGPDVVVEIRSPDDETYEKLPFYAGIGAGEVWVIDRDTKRPEIYYVVNGECQEQPADDDGWVKSSATGPEMQTTGENKLTIRLSALPETQACLP